MDPFTEVRKLAGRASHDPSGPPPSLPTFCLPPDPPGGERVRARAQSVRAGVGLGKPGGGRRFSLLCGCGSAVFLFLFLQMKLWGRGGVGKL